MKTVINTEKVPIKMWLEKMEPEALQQARHLANLPFTYKWVSIMPDSHVGYGMPIGGVLPTTEVVIPNAVGVDIGCGMCVVNTNQKDVPVEKIKKIIDIAHKNIPVGFNWHSKSQLDLDQKIELEHSQVITPHKEHATKQIGSLGGGNHFIELQQDEDGYLHIMIHSGSRNLGKQTADYYQKQAVKLNQKWYSTVPLEWDLAFLPLDTELGQNYMKDMEYCISFALENRLLMMQRMMDAVAQILPDTEFGEVNNEPHNFARTENHFGQNVVVHRKGATSARQGELGMIPGSQGTASYLVEGKGNQTSFMSCSHGSGRVMGRIQAVKELSIEVEKEKLESQGIVHSIHNEADLDEAPGSYKDIEEVMQNQSDLVDIVKKLTPRGVMKG